MPAADRYDAAETAVALQDTTPLVLTMDEALDLSSSGPRVNYNVSVVQSMAITGTEVGFFDADGALIILWANAADDVFVKVIDTNALISVVYAFTNGVPTGLTVQLLAAPIATRAHRRKLPRLMQ